MNSGEKAWKRGEPQINERNVGVNVKRVVSRPNRTSMAEKDSPFCPSPAFNIVDLLFALDKEAKRVNTVRRISENLAEADAIASRKVEARQQKSRITEEHRQKLCSSQQRAWVARRAREADALKQN